MKTVPLQLVTLGLENGKEGLFIGFPLISEDSTDIDCQVQDIWFSDIQEVPDNLTVGKLIRLIAEQFLRCKTTLQ
jgi:hypothetical protein